MIIGFVGQLQNGKTTAANYLLKNTNVKKISFAANVKKIFKETFGVDDQFIEKWKVINESPPNFKQPVRKALQFIGDGFRQIQDNIWIELALRNCSKDEDYVIDDVRYFNECRAIKESGGIIVLLIRPHFVNDDPNPSESQIGSIVKEYLKEDRLAGPIKDNEYVDYLLYNDGTLSDLELILQSKLIPFIESKKHAIH